LLFTLSRDCAIAQSAANWSKSFSPGKIPVSACTTKSKSEAGDRRGRESLAQYILRSPFSLEKMTYQQRSQTVLYRSKMNPVLKTNFAVFSVLDWIATLTTHIPDKGEQLVRYYGYYSNVSRGKRKKEKTEDKTEIREIDAPPLSKELKKRWSLSILDFRFWISDSPSAGNETGFQIPSVFVF
jgi:hypothetical protein